MGRRHPGRRPRPSGADRQRHRLFGRYRRDARHPAVARGTAGARHRRGRAGRGVGSTSARPARSAPQGRRAPPTRRAAGHQGRAPVPGAAGRPAARPGALVSRHPRHRTRGRTHARAGPASGHQSPSGRAVGLPRRRRECRCGTAGLGRPGERDRARLCPARHPHGRAVLPVVTARPGRVAAAARPEIRPGRRRPGEARRQARARPPVARLATRATVGHHQLRRSLRARRALGRSRAPARGAALPAAHRRTPVAAEAARRHRPPRGHRAQSLAVRGVRRTAPAGGCVVPGDAAHLAPARGGRLAHRRQCAAAGARGARLPRIDRRQ